MAAMNPIALSGSRKAPVCASAGARLRRLGGARGGSGEETRARVINACRSLAFCRPFFAVLFAACEVLVALCPLCLFVLRRLESQWINAPKESHRKPNVGRSNEPRLCYEDYFRSAEPVSEHDFRAFHQTISICRCPATRRLVRLRRRPPQCRANEWRAKSHWTTSTSGCKAGTVAPWAAQKEPGCANGRTL